MKSRNKKQISIHVITLLGILLTTFFIYSCNTDGYSPVSYTHLDVYKRQEETQAADFLQNYIEMAGMQTGRKGNNVW